MMYTGMDTEYPSAVLLRVDVIKNSVTIAAHLINGICRGLRKKADEESEKCHGNPSIATNRN